MNKAEINVPKDISQRIKTGKPPTSIKTIINRTLGANNNTIIFSNMANDFNSKFLKGVEKKTINGNKKKKNNFGENSNLNMNNINMNKYIDLNKITTNTAVKTQNNFRGDINLLVNDNMTMKNIRNELYKRQELQNLKIKCFLYGAQILQMNEKVGKYKIKKNEKVVVMVDDKMETSSTQ